MFTASVTDLIWFGATSTSSCTLPEGHSIRTTSTIVASPRPKFSRVSFRSDVHRLGDGPNLVRRYVHQLLHIAGRPLDPHNVHDRGVAQAEVQSCVIQIGCSPPR